MSFELGEAFVRVRANMDDVDGEVQKGMDGAVDGAEGTSKKGGKRLGGALVAGFVGTFIASKGFDLSKQVLSTGAQLEQIETKSRTVFGESLGIVEEWGKGSAAAMGLTQSEATNLATSMGDLLIPMGFTREEAANMSTETMNLSGALSEWSNGQYTAAETGDILTKAMLGERDQLKSLGISITEADVSQRLLENGTNELTGAALQQAKALATQELIMEKSTDAQAAFADGAGSSTRKQAELTAAMNSLKEKGIGLLFPAIQGLVNFTVNTLIPGFTRVGETFSAVAGFVERFRTPIVALTTTIVAIFLPALIQMGIQSTISAAKQVAAWASTSVAAGVAKVKSLAAFAAQGAKWVWLGIKSTVAAAKIALAWMISMGPIALVIAAVVGLVVLVVKNMDKIKAFIAKAWEWVKAKTSALWNGIKSAVSAAVDAVKSKVSSTFEAIKSAVSSAMEAVKSKVSSVWTAIKGAVSAAVDAVKSKVSSTFTAIRTAVASAVDGIKSKVSSTFTAIKTAMSTAATAAKTLVVNAFTSLRTAVSGAIGGLLSRVRRIPGDIRRGLGNLGGLLVGSGKAIIRGLIRGITNMGGAVKSAVSGVLRKARNLLPFSPAKEGPFSGKGWTRYSGESMMDGLAEGIDRKSGGVRSAVDSMAREAAGGMNIAGRVNVGAGQLVGAGVGAGGGSRNVRVGEVNIHLSGSFALDDPVARRRLGQDIRRVLIDLEGEDS